MIAAIAASHDASVVTRNVGDFDDCGVAVINPWDGYRSASLSAARALRAGASPL